jgi:HSP20 family protein
MCYRPQVVVEENNCGLGKEVVSMLMRADALGEVDRLTHRVLGTAALPAYLPMDAWRDGDTFFVELDMPGMRPESLDVTVERGVLTVRAERPDVGSGHTMLVWERPHGVFSRQLFLGESLDIDNVHADYTDGVLRLAIPLARHAKPRKLAVTTGTPKVVNA